MKAAPWIIAAGLLIAALPARAVAQAAAGETDSAWEYVFAPYFLMPNMSGNTGKGPVSVDIEASPADIFDQLQGGFMGYFEARNSTWAIGADFIYMNLGQEGTRSTGAKVEVDMKQTAFLLTGMRRVSPWAEALLGVQYLSLDAGLRSSGPAAVDVSGDESWVDPILGARLTLPGESKWRFKLTCDIGGFGIGSEFTWQVYPVVGYRFSPVFEFAAAYRALGVDYESGSGSEEFVYDVTTFGPEIGVGIHF